MAPIKRNLLQMSLVGLVFAVSAFIMGAQHLNHDTSWYLISTLWWIEGIPIYQDILELNPPLAYYLTAPPVFFAKISGLNAVAIMKAYVFLIAATSVLWGHKILSADRQMTSPQLSALSITVAIGLVIIPLATFAQREHLMLLFAWPYVALSMTGPSSSTRNRRVAVGVFSFLGFALKPYFLAIPLLITLLQMAKERKFTPIFSAQNLTVLVLCIAYLILSYILHPSYFTDVLPKTILVYDAYKRDLASVFGKSQWLLLASIFTFLVLYATSNSRLKYLASVCTAAGMGGLISYLVQSKGWDYQLLPFRVFTWIFIGTTAILLFGEASRKAISVIIMLIAITMLPLPALLYGPYKNPSSIYFAKHFTCPASKQSYQVFTSNVYPSFPLGNRVNAVPAVRSPALWLFPGVVHRLSLDIESAEREYLNAVMDDYTATIIDDLIRAKPQIILVDDRNQKSYFQGVTFDYVEHFKRYPRFNADWSNYSFIEKAHGYKLYRRNNC